MWKSSKSSCFSENFIWKFKVGPEAKHEIDEIDDQTKKDDLCVYF